MYSDLPANGRTQHPYHMYDEIKEQPNVVRDALQSAAEHGDGVGRLVAGARRLFLVGSGTSLYAAQGGAWMFRSFSRGKIDARAMQAYEFATYFPGLRPDDVVIAVSHSGASTMTRRALERARRTGAETVAVTGFPGSPVAALASRVLPTGYEQERSWAHTASYTATLTCLAGVANALAEPEERLDLRPLPEVLAEALQLEELAHRLAASLLLAEQSGTPARIVLVGGGPNAATAREGELKLLETSYVQASSFELEQTLHGPLAAVTPETLLLMIAPEGNSVDRAVELSRAAQQLGVTPVVLTCGDCAGRFEDAHCLVLPDVPEVLSPIAALVPLQLFSYFLAVGKGLNPDLIHRDDERYRAARAAYE